MSRLPPLSFGAANGNFSAPDLDEARVRNRLQKAHLIDSADEIMKMLRSACNGYVLDRMADEQSASAGEVDQYLQSVRSAVEQLLAVIDRGPASMPAAKPVQQRAVIEGLITFEQLQTIRDDSAAFAVAVSSVAADVGKPRRGGGRAPQHARQLRFAKGFVDTFQANSWPSETSRNSLMAQLFLLCLQSVGEYSSTPERILREAASLTN